MKPDDMTVNEVLRIWHFLDAHAEVQAIIKSEARRLHAELCPLLRRERRYAPQITLTFTL